jgi:Protein of unknown function (DUF3592)
VVSIWCAPIRYHQAGCTTNAHYKYVYNDIEYESNLVGFGRASDDFYANSDSVIVYVNPNNPQESVLKKINYESLAFCIIFIGLGVSIFFFSKEVDKIRDLT